MEEKQKEFDEKIVGMSKSDILAQVQREIKMSEDYVAERRAQFRTRLALYNNQRKQRDKIGILTLYTTINTLLALNYTDEMAVEFIGRNFSDSKLADNINSVAEFDHDEMKLPEINYFTQWDRFFYGVGLRLISTYDTVTNTPIVTSMNPMSWLPDPSGQDRFFGFEVERTKEEMEQNPAFFNTENIAVSTPNSEQQATESAQNEAYGINKQPEKESEENNNVYQIDWFTTLENENGGQSKYMLTVSSDKKELYRIEKIQPVTAEEKADESKVPWPLIKNYYSPQRGNPFGVSVGDLVEDKQRAKSVLANLRIAKEKADLYPMYIYNTQMIRNRRDLDFGFNKAIGVNLPREGRLQDVILPMRKEHNNQGTFNHEQSLDAESNISTGADSMQAGVLSSQDRSATEVQQVSMNASTRFLLGFRVNAWGEKTFWQLWYRSHRQYLSRGQKKVVRLQSGFGVRYQTILRKDFITVQDPDVTITSKSELASKREKEKVSFLATAPLLLQDPSKPKASRDFITRYLLKLGGTKPDLIQVMVPDSPDEQAATLENELLSRNVLATPSIDEDHLTHMLIHSAAEDTNAKFAHIEAHRQAYILSGQKARTDMLVQQQMMTGMSTGGMTGAANTQLNMQSRSGQPLDQAVK